MKNVSEESCIKYLNTHFMLSNFFFENHATYEIIWKNAVKCGRPKKTTWHMHTACWIPKATNIHTGCVIIIALPLQQKIARMRLNVMLDLHSLSFCFLKFHLATMEHKRLSWRLGCMSVPKQFLFLLWKCLYSSCQSVQCHLPMGAAWKVSA